jgi:hypothetical protein
LRGLLVELSIILLSIFRKVSESKLLFSVWRCDANGCRGKVRYFGFIDCFFEVLLDRIEVVLFYWF